MRRRPHRAARLAALVISLALGVPAGALGGPADRPARGAADVRVRWDQGGPAVASGRSAPGGLSVVDRQAARAARPRQRDPRLGPDRLVVVAVDASGRELDRQVIADPSLVRIEAPDGRGELQGGATVRQPSVEFTLQIPDDPAVAEIRLFRPRWTGSGFTLDPVGSTRVP
jgi:hypothetical protein